MPEEKPTPEETPDPAAMGAGLGAGPGAPPPEAAPEEPAEVLEARPAPPLQGEGGLRNIHPALDDNAIVVEARRPSGVGRALAAGLAAVLAIGGGLGYFAWRNHERDAARVVATAPPVTHAAPAPDEPAAAEAPAAPTFAAPYGGPARDPAMQREIDQAWAALHAVGVQAPTLAQGVQMLVMQAQAQALAAQTQAQTPPGAASAALPATDCPQTADANVIGVVYFEAGSVRLDAVDVAALRTAMLGAQGRALEIRGAADVGAGEAAPAACADPNHNAQLACQRAAAVAGELARLAPGHSVAASATPLLETIQPRRCARRAEIRLLSS